MSKFLRVIDNETIEIARYRNPRIVFNNPKYEDISNYCDLKAIINPFTLYEENEQLKYQLQQKENIIKEVREKIEDEIERATNSIYIELDEDTYIKMFKKYLQILDKENK